MNEAIVKKPTNPLFIGFAALLMGVIAGSSLFSYGDSWINQTGYIIPNESWSSNVNITGTLTVAGSQVCTAANGLCTSGDIIASGGWTNSSIDTSTDLAVMIQEANAKARYLEIGNCTTSFANYATKNIGVGICPVVTNADQTNDKAIHFGPVIGSTGNGAQGISFSPEIRANVNLGVSYGLIGLIRVSNGTSINNITNLYTNYYRTDFVNNYDGVIDNAYDFFIAQPSIPTGLIRNKYGLYISNMNVTGINQSYGIVQEGMNDTNIFNGRVIMNRALSIIDTLGTNYNAEFIGNINGSHEISVINYNTASEASTSLCLYNQQNKELDYNCITTNGVGYNNATYNSQSPGDMSIESKRNDIHLDVLNSSKSIEVYVGGATIGNRKFVVNNSGVYSDVNIEATLGVTQHGGVPVLDTQSYLCDFNVPYVTTMCYPNYLITIATGTPTKFASTREHLGVINFVNTVAANTGAAVLTDPSQFLLNGSEWFQTSINYSAAILANNVSLIQAGFIDTTAPQTEATDGAYFYIRNGNLSGRIANNSGRNFTTTNITLTRNSWYDLKIAISADGQSANFLVYNYTTQYGIGAPILQLNQTIMSTSAVKIPNTAGRETGAGVTCGVTTAAFTAGTICQLDYVFTEVETQRRPNLIP